MVPQMPMYIGDFDLVLDNIFQEIDSKTKYFLRNNQIIINGQITCNGIVALSYKDTMMTQFYKVLEKEFNKLKWIPGKQGSKFVNVSITFPVRIYSNKLSIPLKLKKGKEKLIKCIILDENSNIPVSDVRLITKYNNCSYFSDKNGEVKFYSEANDEIEINHINYQPFSFNLPENTDSFKIKLTNVVYKLEDIDLVKYSPKRLPNKKSICNYEDWREIKQNQFIIRGLVDDYAAETAVFNGGIDCFYNYLVQEFVFPENAYKNLYLDTVEISFTTTVEGVIKDLIFSKQLNYGIDSALNKIFMEMPKWKPATQSRKKIEQRFIIKLIIGSNKFWVKNYG